MKRGLPGRPKKRDSEKFLICAPKLRVHTKWTETQFIQSTKRKREVPERAHAPVAFVSPVEKVTR